MKSDLYSIKWKDALKGIVIAALTAFILSIYSIINNGDWPSVLQFTSAGRSALAAGLGYLVKNFFTDSVGEAHKTIEKAGGTVTPNYKTPENQ